MVVNKKLVSVVILTRNEGLHIERCLKSAFRISEAVYVVDSRSADGTARIAEDLGARVVSGDFESFSDKFNWALENLDFKTPWVVRLDADEVLTETLVDQLEAYLSALPDDVSGVYVRRQLWFLGRWVRFGGMYPTYSLRIWRAGSVRCETRELDEHMILKSGRTVHFDADVIDDPLTDLSTWIQKHNGYASLEALSALKGGTENAGERARFSLKAALPQRVRWIKENVFYKLPPFIRPCLYFVYRYFLRLGFLDGRTGFIFHFMHALWYRVLVDAKIVESKCSLHRWPPV
jgi:glycosyltransferase involved in cell wall biosynthesis